jgi:hypothetical protein
MGLPDSDFSGVLVLARRHRFDSLRHVNADASPAEQKAAAYLW